LARVDARCEPQEYPERQADVAGWRRALKRVRS
jgi:hypothetical protein